MMIRWLLLWVLGLALWILLLGPILAPAAEAGVICQLRKIGGSWVLIPPPGHRPSECTGYVMSKETLRSFVQ